MGSPISSIIAEVVLQQLEHIAMAQYQPKLWARYVDDTFVVIKKQHKTDFMGILNSVYPDIQFTMEEENQGSLAFLDVWIQRQLDGSLNTRVYRKATCTDRILHFESNHPTAHKASCVKTLFKRVESHCSTAGAKKEERNYLFRVCKRNGYPVRFIRRCNALSESRSNPLVSEVLPQMTRVTLPYICNVSEATARILAPYNIKVAHKPNQTLRAAVMRPKDPLPSMERSAVVYKIDCMDCLCNYVGETSKRVKTRVHEHKLAVKRGEQHSQIWVHMAESGHRFNFAEVGVLASDRTKGGRLIKEAWFSNRNSINRCIDLCPAHRTLRAWSVSNCPPGCRQPNGMFSMPTREIEEETSIPRRSVDDLEEERQCPTPPATPAARTRLQKTRKAAGVGARHPHIKNIGDIRIGTYESNAEGEVREQLGWTPRLRPGRRRAIDLMRTRRPPCLGMPTRSGTCGVWIEDERADSPKNEEKSEPLWEDTWGGGAYNDPITTLPRRALITSADPNELQRVYTRTENIGEREGVEGECIDSRGDCAPSSLRADGSVWRREAGIPIQLGACKVWIEDERAGSPRNEEKREPLWEDTWGGGSYNDLIVTRPRCALTAPADPNDLQRGCPRIENIGEREGVEDECVDIRGDRAPSSLHVDGSMREREIGNGKRKGGRNGMIRQKTTDGAHYADKLPMETFQPAIMTQITQSDIQDCPNYNEVRVGDIEERKDTRRGDSLMNVDWEGKGKGECESLSVPEQGKETRGENNQGDREGAPPTLESKEKKSGDNAHTVKRCRRKLATGMQPSQSGPVTRSRSRAQTLICL